MTDRPGAAVRTDALALFRAVVDGFVSVLPLDKAMLSRCFEYMIQYADPPMDFADATLVTAAEALNTRRVLTLDLADFSVYRVKRGHRFAAMELVGREFLE